MFIATLKAVAGWITGDLSMALAKAYVAKAAAKTDDKRIEADIRIKTLEAKQAVLIEEQKNRSTRWVRPFYAAPFGIYIWKVVVWDKCLGLGTTDPLSVEMWGILGIVVGTYFWQRPKEKQR